MIAAITVAIMIVAYIGAAVIVHAINTAYEEFR